MALIDSFKISANSYNQRDFIAYQPYASIFVGGLGSGKTYGGAVRALMKIFDNPETLGMIAANDSKQLHQSTMPVFWDMLNEIGMIEDQDYVLNKKPLPEWEITSRVKEHDAVLTFRNGAQVALRTFYNYNYRKIRGLNLGWAWLDESRDMDYEAFTTTIGRLRCINSKNIQIWLTSTPNGLDWQYDYFKAAASRNKKLKEKRQYFRGKTQDNEKNLGEGYIDALLETFDEKMIDQEMYGLWTDTFLGQVYYNFDREINIDDTIKHDPSLPENQILMCDFNKTPMAWAIGQKRPGKRGEQKEVLEIYDEIFVNSSNTVECLEELKNRGYNLAHFVVHGDATSKTHGTGITDYVLMREYGIKDIRVPNSNPNVVDRVNSANAKFKNAKGNVGLKVHPRCEHVIEDFARMRFKEGTRILDKVSNLMLSHISDAIGYGIFYRWPATRSSVKQKVKGVSY